MSDDDYFCLLEYVNGQNFLCWCQENPSEMHESPVPPAKVTVQSGVSSSTVIGPHIFEN